MIERFFCAVDCNIVMQNHVQEKGKHILIKRGKAVHGAGDVGADDIFWFGKFNGDSPKDTSGIEIIYDNHKHTSW